MRFCNRHGIVWSYNVSNGPKFTYTGKNAQNLDGLSEKSDWTSISGTSLRKLLLLKLKNLEIKAHDINRLLNWLKEVKVFVYCLVYLCESFSLNLIAQATTSLENMHACLLAKLWPPRGPPWTLKPWKGGAADCHQVQHADCLISWTFFLNFKLNWQ